MNSVEALMSTSVMSVQPTDPVEAAITSMEVAKVRHLVVNDGNGKLLGILSDRDISGLKHKKSAMSSPVKDFMTSAVYSVTPDDLASDAGELMLEQQISSLPVLSSKGDVVGIVTASDFVRLACDLLDEDTTSNTDEPELWDEQ